jgi:HD-GYP domain-containing protein (c-di-GMP phosphodiesterase class II)
MAYVALPLSMLELGKPLPVDIWAPDGRLLLRKGQAILSEHHKEMLSAHQAAMTESDARAWQRSYERMVRTMLRDGVDVDVIGRAALPSQIWEADYVVAKEVAGGWLDLQEVLRGLLYQGAAAISPLQRLEGIEHKALALLKNDADEALFILFQALADEALGYCATHALLAAVVCELTAEKLALPEAERRSLFRAALTMNIGMARAQDSLARQTSIPNEAQRQLIREHPQNGMAILQAIGVQDEDQLDIVRWHHEISDAHGLARNLASRRILRMTDSFVAKMAARKTRLAMSPLGAAKSMFLGAEPHTASLGSAIAGAVGFYPPGTYVQLINGEKAVAVARGRLATHPQVVSIINPGGMPLSKYIFHDTTDPHCAIRAPLNAEKIKVRVSLEKVLKARQERAARA